MSEVPGKHPNDTLGRLEYSLTIGYDRYKHLPAFNGKQIFSFYFCVNYSTTIPHVGGV